MRQNESEPEVKETNDLRFRSIVAKEYALPDVKVSFFSILLFGSPLEIGLQLFGTISAIAAGTISGSNFLIGRGGVTAHDDFLRKFRQFVWGSDVTKYTKLNSTSQPS